MFFLIRAFINHISSLAFNLVFGVKNGWDKKKKKKVDIISRP